MGMTLRVSSSLGTSSFWVWVFTPYGRGASRSVGFLLGSFLWFMGPLESLFHTNFFLIPSYALSHNLPPINTCWHWLTPEPFKAEPQFLAPLAHPREGEGRFSHRCFPRRTMPLPLLCLRT